MSLTMEYLSTRPSTKSSFSSKIVCNPSSFNMLSSLVGGTIGGTKSIKGAEVGNATAI